MTKRRFKGAAAMTMRRPKDTAAMTKSRLHGAATRFFLAAAFVATAMSAGVFHAGAQNYPVAAIPEDLKKGSDAVVRLGKTEFEYLSPKLSKERYTEIVTVLTRNGEGAANFSAHTDMFSSISGTSGRSKITAASSIWKTPSRG